MKALVIEPHGAMRLTDLTHDSWMTELDHLLGGPGEGIQGRDLNFWCHDEGKLIGLALNPVATDMYHHIHPGCSHDTLVGTVVVTGSSL